MLNEEQLLLTRHEAEVLISSLRQTVKRVVRVCTDGAVLFIGELDRPWTAWLNRDDGQLAVQFERGWPATFNSYSRVSDPVTLRPPQPTDDDPATGFTD